jgi:hypothetical protein
VRGGGTWSRRVCFCPQHACAVRAVGLWRMDAGAVVVRVVKLPWWRRSNRMTRRNASTTATAFTTKHPLALGLIGVG